MHTILLALGFLLQTSIYTLSITDTNGNTHALSQHQGKKMMLVNIATGSDKVGQLAELQQLQQQFGDSLVIIAFPSNGFGNEPKSDAEIRQFCQNVYNISFVIAAKNPVTGPGAQPVYSWLASASQNGGTSITINGDFQKILIDSAGDIVGVFAPAVSPLHASVIHTITAN